MRGNGPDILETPIVVAHSVGTEIFLNGESTPFSTLEPGEFIVISSDHFSPDGNIYISTTQPAYVYQSMGGNNEGTLSGEASGSLIQVPPLSCTGQKEVYEIPLTNAIGEVEYSSSLSIVKKKGTNLSINNGAISLGGPKPVLGNGEFETYKIDNISGDIMIESSDAIQTTLIGGRDWSGWSCVFSGFSQSLEGEISISRKNGCDDVLLVQANVPGEINWYLDGEILNNLSGFEINASKEGEYKAVLTYQLNCNQLFRDTSNIIIIKDKPELIIEHIDICSPTAVNTNNGRLDIYAVGGSGVYTYSINDRASQMRNSSFTGLNAGQYVITVSDSLGCEVSQNIVIEALQFEVKVYPNPFQEEVFLSITDIENHGKWTIDVFDITGKQLYTEEQEVSQNLIYNLSLGVISLPAGTYLLHFIYTDGLDICGNKIENEEYFRIIKMD